MILVERAKVLTLVLAASSEDVKRRKPNAATVRKMSLLSNLCMLRMWRLMYCMTRSFVSDCFEFDDYLWKGYLKDYYSPRVAIESFTKCTAPEIEIEEAVSALDEESASTRHQQRL